MTRTDRIEKMLPPGYTVRTYSPGDGKTRYRFFEGQPNADYFSGRPEHTALGAAAAKQYATDLASGGARYKIVRTFQRDHRPKIIRRGLTLEEAQAHCALPETSSRTATSARARRLTAKMGPWFDGYDVDSGPRRRR